jgi:hypothetical protein
MSNCKSGNYPKKTVKRLPFANELLMAPIIAAELFSNTSSEILFSDILIRDLFYFFVIAISQVINDWSFRPAAVFAIDLIKIIRWVDQSIQSGVGNNHRIGFGAVAFQILNPTMNDPEALVINVDIVTFIPDDFIVYAV